MWRGRVVAAAALVFLMILQIAGPTLIARAEPTPVSLEEIVESFYSALAYIENITRTYKTNDNENDVTYHFVSEYPDIPVWGHLANLTFAPGFYEIYRCIYDGVAESVWSDVKTEIVQEEYTDSYSEWVLDYKFQIGLANRAGAAELDIVKARLIEKQYSNGSIKLIVSVVETDNADVGCTHYDGSQLDIYVGPYYAGKASELLNTQYQVWLDKPLGSFRFSVRHAQVMSSLLYHAIMYNNGDGDPYLDQAVLDMFNAIFQQSVPIRDLYGNALMSTAVSVPYSWSYMYPDDDVNAGPFYFYDAHWFTDTKTGYDRLYDWSVSMMMFDNLFTDYPLYPYKSKVVAVSEISNSEGGNAFLWALEHVDRYPSCWFNGYPDAMLLAWRGLYYVIDRDYNNALDEWNQIINIMYDGTGVKTCYSDNYSTVRLATAIMLGALLAGHGYIDWNVVDSMVSNLLKAQWKGSGYYKPEDGDWVKIYKWDHRGGFLVAYNIAPDSSFGSTGFRPGITDVLTSGYDMDPEYSGVIPTNAETTLAALYALWLYTLYRHGAELTYYKIFPEYWIINATSGASADADWNRGTIDIHTSAATGSQDTDSASVSYTVKIWRPEDLALRLNLQSSLTGTGSASIKINVKLVVNGNVVGSKTYNYVQDTASLSKTLYVAFDMPVVPSGSAGVLWINMTVTTVGGSSYLPPMSVEPLTLGYTSADTSLSFVVYWPTP